VLTFSSLYSTLSILPCRERLVNPLTVDLASLRSLTVNKVTYASTLSRDAFERHLWAQFVTVGVVSKCALYSCSGPEREISFHLPALVLDRLQTCLNVAFDTWDTSLRMKITAEEMFFGVKLGTLGSVYTSTKG